MNVCTHMCVAVMDLEETNDWRSTELVQEGTQRFHGLQIEQCV